MAIKTIVKKNTNENVKAELLKSLRENDENEEIGINTANNTIEAIEHINRHKEIIKTQHKRVIRHIYKQAEILKFFKETKSFFENEGQIRFTIYFKIAVYKLLI